MVKPTFYRGKKSNVEKLPLKNGQFMIGTVLEKIMSIYLDTKDESGKLIRVVLDLSEYEQRIKSLEDEINELKLIISENIDINTIQTSDGVNIVTNNDEKLVFNENSN